MTITGKDPVDVLIVAVPETAGSALYGMLDVLLAAGNIWQTLARAESAQAPFRVRIVADTTETFTCGNGIPVARDCAVDDGPEADPDQDVVDPLLESVQELGVHE